MGNDNLSSSVPQPDTDFRKAVLVALVALFFPWVTIVVVAQRFPEAGLVLFDDA
jgi:hypothetical protein